PILVVLSCRHAATRAPARVPFRRNKQAISALNRLIGKVKLAMSVPRPLPDRPRFGDCLQVRASAKRARGTAECAIGLRGCCLERDAHLIAFRCQPGAELTALPREM